MNQKLKLISSKKSYMQIDFAFAIFLFLIFFASIYSYYLSSINSYDLTFKDSKLIAQSQDICKLLISSSGIPNNWESDISKLKTIGLLKINSSILDPNKISLLTPTNYLNISDSLNIANILNIKIKGLKTNTIYLDFGFNSSNSIPKLTSKYNCYANYNNLEMAKILVEVWQ